MVSSSSSASRLRVLWRHFGGSRMGEMASKGQMPAPETALPGRTDPITVSAKHNVNGNRTVPPFPEGTETVVFGMGCFWGAERKFWRQNGVYSTQVGFAGGYTPHPTYREVCTGGTGHTEVVRVVFHPDKTSFANLLKVFWESHNPTQGMRQGNDGGTMYRSAIYTCSNPQLEEALASRDRYQKRRHRPVSRTSLGRSPFARRAPYCSLASAVAKETVTARSFFFFLLPNKVKM
uniref:peptide-methionine (S)-S-oxide reductase n=1 Tax=Scophthalmus maximus TaxID=52904 RepID=A0A8D3DML0_SCOMX